MAELVGAVYTSHGPFTTLPPERWEERRKDRSFRDDVPVETPEERIAKGERLKKDLGILKELIESLSPDVLMVFGDDQFENFNFNNYPTLSVFVGEEFHGADASTRGRPEAYHRVAGHPSLGVGVLTGLLERGFDPAFSMGDSDPEKGMCHAVMRPLEFFDLYHLPVVPVLMNGYYPPQARAVRCYQVGRAVREIIDQFPEDLRIVVIGSGGMWHTPGRPMSYLNEEFDHTMLDYLTQGDVKGMAEYFDNYRVPPGDLSQDVSPGVRGMTGMPSLAGPQMGTREICNWIGAAGVVDGRPHVVVDYVPVYASPIGTAFAYCTDI